MPCYEQPTTSDRIMWDLWMSLYSLPAVTVANELGIFAAVAACPGTAGELAERLGYRRRALTAVLGVLTGNGLLQVYEGSYHATDAVRQYLLPDSPAYWGPVLLTHRGSDTHRWLVGMLTTSRATVRRDAIGGIGDEDRPTDAWTSGHISANLARSVAAFMHTLLRGRPGRSPPSRALRHRPTARCWRRVRRVLDRFRPAESNTELHRDGPRPHVRDCTGIHRGERGR